MVQPSFQQLHTHFSPPPSSKVVVAVVTALEGTPVGLGMTPEDLEVGSLIATAEGLDLQPMPKTKAGTKCNNFRLRTSSMTSYSYLLVNLTLPAHLL